MNFTLLIWMGNPITWLVVGMIVATISRQFKRRSHRPADPSRVVRGGPTSPEGMGAALMFLSMAYRPNHAFVAKAQIVEREEADDDDQGGPDTARRHLLRQLRRIRRGERVDRLVLRLE